MYRCTKTTTKAWHCELEWGRGNNHTGKAVCSGIADDMDIMKGQELQWVFLYRTMPIMEYMCVCRSKKNCSPKNKLASLLRF